MLKVYVRVITVASQIKMQNKSDTAAPSEQVKIGKVDCSLMALNEINNHGSDKKIDLIPKVKAGLTYWNLS